MSNIVYLFIVFMAVLCFHKGRNLCSFLPPLCLEQCLACAGALEAAAG